MQLETALPIAYAAQAAIMEHCEITHIAGSCRRLKPDVHDIELCCLPKTELVTNRIDMFTDLQTVEVNKDFVRKALKLGKIQKGCPSGRYMQILLPESIDLDLFIPQDYDYYRQLAIRTGPAEYSYAVLAVGWRKLGWCGTKDGLRLMTDCIEKRNCSGKSTWQCINPIPELPPHWKSEREFYDWIKVPWAEPTERA